MHIHNIKNRWQAFGLHLAISLVIFIILLSIIIFVWYPGAFINLGGYQGIRIAAGVDLVLGPILTLIIFNPNKKSTLVKLDLAIIATIQTVALFIGISLIYKERPIVQVLSDDGLYIHTYSEFKTTNTDYSSIQDFPGRYPKIIYLALPQDRKGSNQLKMKSYFEDSKSITLAPEHYKKIDKVSQQQINNRLKDGDLNKKEDCYWLQTISIHKHRLTSCFNQRNGMVLVN